MEWKEKLIATGNRAEEIRGDEEGESESLREEVEER